MDELPDEVGAFESERTDVLRKRLDVLRRLARAPAYKRDLVDEMEQSRSTINRAIGDLEEVDLVRRDEDGFTATIAGQLALERLSAFQTELDDIIDAEAVLEPLPYDAPVKPATVAGSQAVLATDPTPYRPQERLQEDLTDAVRYRAVLPALDDSRHVRLLYEHVVTQGRPAELVVGPEVLETLRAEFPRQTAAMAESGEFRLLVGDPPPFGLVVLDVAADAGAAPETRVHLTVFSRSGGVHGGLVNGTEPAVRWAETLYDEVRGGAEDRTDTLLADTGGGAGFTPADGDPGDPLPVSLEREGFVRLDVPYFRDRSVADPTTAWRAGLTLPEVHTGYAVERTIEEGAGGEHDESTDAHTPERRELTAALVEDLAEGVDTVLVGGPGSGKSTTAKRVACDWYDAGRGPVLYREGGRGRPFESVEDLAMAVKAAEGRALVVVEDAVRPDADAVFDAIERLADAEVSFLLDAREGEWRDPPGEVGDVSALRARTMPPLSEADVERVVDHFERTTGEAVGVPAGRLHETVRAASASGGEGPSPGEVMLLLHRLSTLADPLDTDPGRTSLEAAVAEVYEALAGEDLAMDVCVLVNALNAAGVAVEPGMAYAVAEPEAFGTVDAALERLEGQVLFPAADGYRTVHEAWSVAFLEHLLAAEGESLAAERFGDTVTHLLGLADDPARRDRIARHRDGELALTGIVDDPGEWAGSTADAVLSLARGYPKLAPLFGDGERDSIALPAACPDEVADELPIRVGWGYIERGEFEAAERAFDRLPDEESETGFERWLGLSWTADKRGEFEAALEHAERCLAVAEALDDDVLRARAERRFGRVHSNAEAYEAAEPHLRRALEGFEAAGQRHRLATVLDYLGSVTWRQAEYEAAREYHERALALSRELGDRPGAARSLHYLGSITLQTDEFDAARRFYEESLEINRHLGNRNGVAAVLDNLGLAARHQGEYDAARDYHEESLAVARDIGNPRSEAASLGNLGLLAKAEGEYAAAREYYEESVAIHRDLGLDHGEAKLGTNLAEVAVEQGDLEAAREHLDRCSEVFEGMGDDRGRAIVANVRGLVAREEGDDDTAVEQFRRSVELFREVGVPKGSAESRRNLGRALAARGEADAAREEWATALEAFEEVGAPQEALETLRLLVETCREAGDDPGKWCERAREALAEAPEPVAAEHREWVESEAGALDAD